MSTRSIIVVHGGDLYDDSVIRLYKHSDGYPTGALSAIDKALEQAIKNQYEDSDGKKRINVSALAGFLIGAGTTKYGMGIRIDSDEESTAVFGGTFDPKKHLGNQGDLEWVYIIDVNKKTVSILGGGYTGKTPDKFKLADPFAYAKCLYPQYQQGTIDKTQLLISSIEAWGFKVVSKKTKIKTAKLMAVSRE